MELPHEIIGMVCVFLNLQSHLASRFWSRASRSWSAASRSWSAASEPELVGSQRAIDVLKLWNFQTFQEVIRWWMVHYLIIELFDEAEYGDFLEVIEEQLCPLFLFFVSGDVLH
jgi:hypothetical protein